MKLNKKTNKIGFGEKFSYGCINLGNIPIMTLITSTRKAKQRMTVCAIACW